MTFQYYNPNPSKRNGIDCAVRALSKALNITWEEAYTLLCTNGFIMYDMPNAIHIVNATLRQQGFERHIIPNECPNCYTLKDYCEDHPNGIFVIGTGTHAVAVIDGDYYDSWDSGNVIPIYYFTKE